MMRFTEGVEVAMWVGFAVVVVLAAAGYIVWWAIHNPMKAARGAMVVAALGLVPLVCSLLGEATLRLLARMETDDSTETDGGD